MQNCLANASNFIAADKCTDALLHLDSVASLSGPVLAIIGAVVVSAIFATLTFKRV